jgi:hypothetical protein
MREGGVFSILAFGETHTPSCAFLLIVFARYYKVIENNEICGGISGGADRRMLRRPHLRKRNSSNAAAIAGDDGFSAYRPARANGEGGNRTGNTRSC